MVLIGYILWFLASFASMNGAPTIQPEVNPTQVISTHQSVVSAISSEWSQDHGHLVTGGTKPILLAEPQLEFDEEPVQKSGTSNSFWDANVYLPPHILFPCSIDPQTLIQESTKVHKFILHQVFLI